MSLAPNPPLDPKITRFYVPANKANILDNDKVLIASNHTYTPQTEDHRRTWPRVVAAIGEKGAWYSTLRAIAGGNYDYIAYLIGDVGALVCPAMEERMGGQR